LFAALVGAGLIGIGARGIYKQYFQSGGLTLFLVNAGSSLTFFGVAGFVNVLSSLTFFGVALLSFVAAKVVVEEAKNALNIKPSSFGKFYYRGGFESKMTKREAALILGCRSARSFVLVLLVLRLMLCRAVRRESSSKEKIMERYRALMKLNHPDMGGSPFLSSKINEAKVRSRSVPWFCSFFVSLCWLSSRPYLSIMFDFPCRLVLVQDLLFKTARSDADNK
jgi:DnaJ family protein C protein 19